MCPSQLARLHTRTEVELVLFAGADDSPVLLPPHLTSHITHTLANLLQLWPVSQLTTGNRQKNAENLPPSP